jgi:hypothetical protein
MKSEGKIALLGTVQEAISQMARSAFFNKNLDDHLDICKISFSREEFEHDLVLISVLARSGY